MNSYGVKHPELDKTMDFYLNISKTIIFPSLRLKTLIFVVVWHECIMGKILFIIIFRI